MTARAMKIPMTAIALALFLAAAPASARASSPMDTVKSGVEEVLDILRDKEMMRPDNKDKRRAAIRRAVSRYIDFQEMAKRSLGVYWRQRTPEERREFVDVYTDFLENIYVSKIEKYTNEQVVYTGERLDGDYATVETQIVSAQRLSIPLSYRLMKEGGSWKVYDVIVEGVSLVNNYRSQFRDIISSGSYEDLVKRLRDKVRQGASE